MKTCCRCHRDLDESRFVKSPRYLDGLTQPCKDCRKEKQDARLANNLLCIMCKTEPHMKGNPYCRICIRIINDLPVERERPNVDRDNHTMCCRCKIRPRRKGGHYCVECANEMQRDWWPENYDRYMAIPGNRMKKNARQFVYWKVQNGEMGKLPCEVCGNPKVQAHHYLGYERIHWLDVKWLCFKHHLEAEREIRKKLTSPSS